VLEEQVRDLVAANRILAHEGVVDGYGHVSVRCGDHADRFLMSRSRSPELVEASDIVEHRLDGEAAAPDSPALYAERFIHAAIYATRPDVQAVVHTHAYELIPYGVTGVPLRPIFHAAARMGAEVPIWDMNDEFGDTNMLVTNLAQGRSLATRLAENRMVLMRGHGATIVATTIQRAVMAAIYAQVNARFQLFAMQLGPVTYLTPGELAKAGDVEGKASLGLDRNWEYLKRRAGCQ
jgi:HCOMODA/2-hydroxy-3-carboxy-muconic semialdehyde decarboxylase